MVGSPALRREERQVSSCSFQSTGLFSYRFPRLASITIAVNLAKCHTIVKDRHGEIRQYHKNPTSTGEDSTIYSLKYNINLRKVREPTVFEEEFVDSLRLPREVNILHHQNWSAIQGTRRQYKKRNRYLKSR